MGLTASTPLVGQLVRLRARELDDEPRLHELFNDPELTQYLAIRYPLSHAAEKEYLEGASKSVSYERVDLSIVTLADDLLIGGIDFRNVSPEDRRAALGMAIADQAYWDRGYGTDALRVMCRFGFEQMNFHRIELDVYDTNPRARHVYEKVGFKHEGTKREGLYKFGRYIDIHIMGLLEGELLTG
ncbi:MAG: GNAT family protein [Dehalococcoidia bacterium]